MVNQSNWSIDLINRNIILFYCILQQPVKQPVTRTQSAPQRSHGLLYNRLEASEPQATDIEINARLDSLCRSVTECALAGSGKTSFQNLIISWAKLSHLIIVFFSLFNCSQFKKQAGQILLCDNSKILHP